MSIPRKNKKPPVFGMRAKCHKCDKEQFYTGSSEREITKAMHSDGWIVKPLDKYKLKFTCKECKEHKNG